MDISKKPTLARIKVLGDHIVLVDAAATRNISEDDMKMLYSLATSIISVLLVRMPAKATPRPPISEPPVITPYIIAAVFICLFILIYAVSRLN